LARGPIPRLNVLALDSLNLSGSDESESKVAIDRTVRRLTALQESASTARVLNLAGTMRKFAHEPDSLTPPFFNHHLLNRAIILKHRIRANEIEQFAAPKQNATKVLLPIDPKDLKLGAHYFFMGQKDFEEVTKGAFGDALALGQHDRQVLDLIDALPSLDPFLLREHLRRSGFEPARAYFNISDADLERMHNYVEAEITPLVAMSFQAEVGSKAQAAKLVTKILSSNAPDDLGPLRGVLMLDEKEFLDGIFAWRGFLYYKWVLESLQRQTAAVTAAIELVQPRGQRDPEASAYIGPARNRICLSVQKTVGSIGSMLSVYDKAYQGLTQNGNPAGFRDFLLTAPAMFTNLGEQLGAVQHIVSYWSHRFPIGRPAIATAQELMEFLLDFEDSLSFNDLEASQDGAQSYDISPAA
jgi:hypothetical protein